MMAVLKRRMAINLAREAQVHNAHPRAPDLAKPCNWPHARKKKAKAKKNWVMRPMRPLPLGAGGFFEDSPMFQTPFQTPFPSQTPFQAPSLPNISLLQSQLGNLQSQMDAAQLQEDVLRGQLADALAQVQSLGAEKRSLLDDVCGLRQALDADHSVDLERQLQEAEARLVRNAQEASTANDMARRLEAEAEQAHTAVLNDNHALRARLSQLHRDHDDLDEELQTSRRQLESRCQELQAALRARGADSDERQALEEKAAVLERRLVSAIRAAEISDEARRGLEEKCAQLERMLVEAHEEGSNVEHDIRERCMALEEEVQRLTMCDRRRSYDDPNEPMDSLLHELRGAVSELEDTLQNERSARHDAETQLGENREANVQLRREVAMLGADIQILQHDHLAERDKMERLWSGRHAAAGAADKRMRLELEEQLTVARERAEILEGRLSQRTNESPQGLSHSSAQSLESLDLESCDEGVASISECSTAAFTPRTPTHRHISDGSPGARRASPAFDERQQSHDTDSTVSSPHYRRHTLASKAKIRQRPSSLCTTGRNPD